MTGGLVELMLPGGCWVDGVRYRRTQLRNPTGRDETFLQETRGARSVAHRVTTFLTRLVERVGPVLRVTPETIAGLTIGDREALLLGVRRLMLGTRLSAVLRCPSCRSPMDLDLRIDDLLTPPYAKAAVEHETSLETAEGSYRVRFRLPTGADQEAAAQEDTAEQGAATILQRTISAIFRDGHLVEQFPDAVAEQVSQRMAELDPQAELELRCTCPACRHEFATVLDTAAYFFEELAARAQGLTRDVHLLALNYHWSERSILSMASDRRRAYAQLLEEDVERRMGR